MENYIVSARKYRPSTFETVVGQQALTHTLKTAIESGRLAHAYLFCGPRGVGKTSCARIFAKTINCQHLSASGEACNECESCKAFNEGRSYNIVELDAASNNSVDEMRSLTEKVRIPPQLGKYKVYIIDEVHMLSTSAFNAFLKTLEEPPEHAIFILATTEKHKIIPTILSRCQIYDFSRITVQDIVEQLQRIASREGITTEPTALNLIAQKADGAMRDALSIFDQVAASSMGNITYRSTIDNLNVLDYEYYFRLIKTFLAGDVPQALLIYKEIRDHGFDSLFFVNGLASHLRDLLVASNPNTLPLLEVSTEVIPQYQEQAKECPVQFLYKGMSLCNDCDFNYRTASNKQFLVELTLIKLCQILHSPEPSDNGTHLKTVSSSQSQPTSAAQTSSSSSAPQATTTSAPTATIPTATDTPPVAYSPKPRVAKQAPRAQVNPTQRISISNIGLSDDVASTDGHKKESRKPLHQRNAYTKEQFHDVWKKYIKEHPREVVLINTMRESFPAPTDKEFHYKLMVDNIGQQEIVISNLGNLLDFLRSHLSNDAITMEITVNENIQKEKFYSPQELVADMMTRNPNVKTLVDTFHLSIY